MGLPILTVSHGHPYGIEYRRGERRQAALPGLGLGPLTLLFLHTNGLVMMEGSFSEESGGVPGLLASQSCGAHGCGSSRGLHKALVAL